MIPNNSIQIESIPLHNLDSFDLLAKQVVEGFIIGLHKSPFHGFSVEFAEHRLYNPGEPTKNIDWKVYARTDKMFVKRFEEETNLRCQIVLDTSSSMFYPDKKEDNKWNKIEFSALAAASLMHLLKKQRDAFGLTLFDKNMYIHTQCKSSTSHHKMLLNYLQSSLELRQSLKTTSAAQTLHQVADSIHKRSMVVIFSDMFENTDKMDEIFSAIQHLKHNKHEVILFQVMDKDSEVSFDFENRPHLFVDLESGEEVRLQTNQVKELYQKQMEDFKSLIRLKCLQYKVDYIEVDIKSGFNKVLQSYLVKRARMRT